MALVGVAIDAFLNVRSIAIVAVSMNGKGARASQEPSGIVASIDLGGRGKSGQSFQDVESAVPRLTAARGVRAELDCSAEWFDGAVREASYRGCAPAHERSCAELLAWRGGSVGTSAMAPSGYRSRCSCRRERASVEG
jgi:hypothetical protein